MQEKFWERYKTGQKTGKEKDLNASDGRVNKKAYDTDTVKMVTVNWFAVAGVILGAIVANVVTWGIASINGMAVAAVCYVIGELVHKNK